MIQSISLLHFVLYLKRLGCGKGKIREHNIKERGLKTVSSGL